MTFSRRSALGFIHSGTSSSPPLIPSDLSPSRAPSFLPLAFRIRCQGYQFKNNYCAEM